MIFNVKSLAAKKHLETGHAEVEWFKALESARQSLEFAQIDFRELELIVHASATPAKFTVMSRLIYQYSKSHLQADRITGVILGLVNDSAFSLVEWIDAIDHFNTWLSEEKRKADFLHMLQYLDCCAASPEAREGGQTLAELLADMLNLAGYEG